MATGHTWKERTFLKICVSEWSAERRRMINPDAEINRLRYYLTQKNWLPHEVDQICDLVSRDVNEVILDIVASAVADATEYAESIGASEFIDEMDVIEVGGSFMVTTISGKLDYSQPEKQMLPHLLKNAKTSADGSRYRVIPVGGKKTETIPANIFSVLQDRQSRLREARAALQQYNEDTRSARAG